MSASLRRADFAAGALYRPGLPPGVYEARATAAVPRIVRLDTACLIGLAERGPVNTPVPLESFAEFTRLFGGAVGGLKLPQAVRAFFAEGGRRCIAIRCMDHRNARTTRFILPGVAVYSATPARRAVRIAARNPGSWGNRMLLRLAARRRALPLVRDFGWVTPQGGGAPVWQRRWLAPAHRGLPGTTLRLPGTRFGVRSWHVTRVSAVEPAGRGTVRLTLTPEPPAGFRQAASATGAEEVLLSLAITLDGQVVESWDEAGLHADHPRFLPRLIGRRAASEMLLPPPVDGSDPETEAGSPDRIWGGPEDPAGSEFLRPSALQRDAWLYPSEDLLAAPEGLLAAGADLPPVRRGRDAAETTRRHHFLEPAGITPSHLAGDADHRFLVFANRPAALDALGEWDSKQPFSPAALIVLPDLLHPAPAEPAASDPAPEPGAPCFGVCIPPAAIVARPVLDYRWLGQDLDDLRQTQAAVVAACEAHGARVALLDLPPRLTPGDIGAWRRALASDRAALYAPWLLAPDAGDPRAAPVVLPPACVAAGIAARVEIAGHPWSAPANQQLRSAFAVADDPGLPDAGFLHEERVDVIRPTERGLMLLGSRTTSLDRDWTHISVRRLVDWLKLQIARDLEWAPFEPNNHVLWAGLVRTATQRLRAVFDAGGLAGRTAREAYFARCDAMTTPLNARDSGQVILLVGVAPAVPAEFIVFRLVRAGLGAALEVEG
ncbi:phage tail sheath C-terminal domain-containing protein [Roseomonas sp. AR75]|uniref:phage tail sheath C-terminal domain-containing protein n=1 Tax=Roseomonas sp. AR75 TaxID=2562311 RepID=UPI0010C0BA42|nr:phage tail sheath C-terminal domain-containing protein [Roseomonas sp. AR75]